MFNPTAMRDLIAQRGLSLSKLASALDSDRALVSAWANGRREPLLESVVRLAEVLDCPVDDLVFRGDARLKEIKRREQAASELAALDPHDTEQPQLPTAGE